jgi:UDP-N-acetylmuramate dehydrogenase
MTNRISNPLEKINCRFSIKDMSPIGAGPESVQGFMPASSGELSEAIAYCIKHCITAPIVIGRCTNILVSERIPSEQVFLNLCRMNKINVSGTSIAAQAGASLESVVEASLSFSEDLSRLSGIPGTIGGAAAGNAGADGIAIGDFIREVHALDYSGQTLILRQPELGYAYRSSLFKTRNDLVITEVILDLLPGDPAEARIEREAALNRRRSRGIGLEPSLGSFFLNPGQNSAGKLLDDAGLRGFILGRAQVSTHHANIIINPGRLATAEEIAELASYCRKKVLELYNIDLKPEVNLYGLTI